MSRFLYRIGHFAGRHPWRILAAWVLVGVTAFVLNSSLGGPPDESFSLPGSDSQRAADAISDRFPQETLNSSNVIFHAEDGVTTPAAKKAVEQAVTALADGTHVTGVSDPYDPRGSTVSKDATTAIATVGFDSDVIGPEDFDEAELATQAVRDAGIQVEYDGGLGYAKGDAAPGSEVIGIAVAVVVLAIAFGSIVAMSLPIVVALVGLLIGTSAIGVMSGAMPVPSIASIVGIMIGLGVGIDYALFILARHRQNLETGMPVPEAIGRANATAGLSVLFAGVTVVLAIAGLYVSGIPMMATMGYASAIMVAVSMLPPSRCCRHCSASPSGASTASRCPSSSSGPRGTRDSTSARWTARVVKHPVRYGAAAALALVVLAIPVLSMRLGFADAGNDAPVTTTRKAYDLVADHYGPGNNGPLTVVVDTAGTAADAQATADKLVSEIGDVSGVASVDAPCSTRRATSRSSGSSRPPGRRTRPPRPCSPTCGPT